MIPTSTIVLMGIAGVAALLLPFIFILVLRHRFKVRWIPILIGAAVFMIFAMGLEQISHLLILQPQADGTIPILQSAPWLYVLYGVLAAGIFEETGRLVAFLLMKRKYRQIDSAVSYGIGHGGIEAVIVLGISMLTSIVLAVLINTGGLPQSQLPPGTADTLAAQSGYTYVLGIVERIFAIGLHIALSVIVFTAVMQKGRWWLYPLAILLHALANITAAMTQAGLLANMWLMYGGFIVITGITVWIAYVVGIGYRNDNRRGD